jgi:hypothetical protein
MSVRATKRGCSDCCPGRKIACAEADTRHVPQGVVEIGHAHGLAAPVPDDLDRLRYVDQRLGEFGKVRDLDLVVVRPHALDDDLLGLSLRRRTLARSGRRA